MAGFRKIATVDDIPEGTLKGFEVDHQKLVVAHTAAGFYAVEDECSHDFAPISDGHLAGNDIVCPRHGARFDLETGDVTAPPAVAPIETLELKIDGDDILVRID